jgi:tetratricopeptide (TPR) repeat protein
MKKLSILLALVASLIGGAVAQDNQGISLAYEYYNQGEKEKALELFKNLARNASNIPFIHERYLELLQNAKEYDIAEKYLQNVIKNQPDNYVYQVDLGSLYFQMDQEDKMAKVFESLIQQIKSDPMRTRYVATYFYNSNFSKWSIQTYLAGREFSKNSTMYAMDLATIYRLTNNKEGMINEYFIFLQGNPANLPLVKDQLQNALTDENDIPDLRTNLIRRIQQQPDNFIFADLLIWVNIQLKDFYQAYVQSRAFDRRFKPENSKVFEVGIIAYQNKDYRNAALIFDNFIKENVGQRNYLLARLYMITSKEENIKSDYPVNLDNLRSLMNDYDLLVKEIGLNSISLEAMRNKARLHAFYLNELDSAITLLNKVIEYPATEANLKAKAKIDLGDILILNEEPWESSLLYSQVEKSLKGNSLAFEAKLRNAKLNFYKGEFELSKAHLDILKEATTREIANDALSLSLLINDNKDSDSSYSALRIYADADMLYFMNRKDESILKLEELLKAFPNHSLVDEAYWLKAKILKERGDFSTALSYLNLIFTQYGTDILGDDALFEMAKIYEGELNDKEKAMELYQQFLRTYAGSLFAEEARRRFRKLRGDSGPA